MTRLALFLPLVIGCAAAPPNDEAPYADLLKGATKLTIRSGGLCHRTPAEERTLLTVTDEAEIRKVVDCLKIPPPPRDLIRCRCCGDPTLEFFKGDALLASVGLHHGVLIRSLDVSDVELTPRSAQTLCRWLADHGIPEPEVSRRRIQKP